MVKIAIAGSGDLARYVSEELLNKSIQVVVLTRSQKKWLENTEEIEARFVDFNSAENIANNIKDCDGLVSVLSDLTMNSVTSHNAIIDAILNTERCRRFVPSEYGSNLHDYPDQPIFYTSNHKPIRDRLSQLSKNDIEWTLLNTGWFMNYLIPRMNRYIKDFSEISPLDFETGRMIIPGTGNELTSFTSARDVAKSIANLFLTKKAWDEIIYVCGETTTWNIIAKDFFFNFKISYKSLSNILEDYIDAKSRKDANKQLTSEFEIWSCSGALDLPKQIVEKHKRIYFPDIEFYTIRKLIDGCKDSNTII